MSFIPPLLHTLSDLRPYQLEGVEFLTTMYPGFDKPHKILADDAGLGKTWQVCAALKKLNAKSALIVCPASLDVKMTWRRDLVDWGVCDYIDVQILTKTSERLTGAPFVIVSFELLLAKALYNQLNNRYYDVAIIDEAHRCKTLTSKTSALIFSTRYHHAPLIARGKHRWLLTGTFAPNGRPIEMFPALKALAPKLLGKYAEYGHYGLRFCDGHNKDDFSGASHLDELADMLVPIMLRRQKCDVEKDLPPVIYEDVYIDIGEMLEDETNTPDTTLRKLIGINKIPYVVDFIKNRLAEDPEPVLIFTYHREVSQQLAKQLNAKLIYGGTSQAVRRQILAEFTAGRIPALVAQYASMGTAVDGLQRNCCRIYQAEQDWVPDHQPVGRVHRIGQLRQVWVTRLIAEFTLEDVKMLGSGYRKKRNINALLNKKREVKQMANGILETFFDGLVSGVSRIADAIERIADATGDEGEQEAPKVAASKTESKGADTKTADTAGSAGDAVTIADVKIKALEYLKTFGEGDENQKKGTEMLTKIWGKAKKGAKKLSDFTDADAAKVMEVFLKESAANPAKTSDPGDI